MIELRKEILFQDDGNYSGLIGALITDKIDLIATELSITPDRSSVIDFTFPHTGYPVVIALGHPGKQFNWTVYTKAIKPEMCNVRIIWIVRISHSYFQTLQVLPSLPHVWIPPSLEV